MLQAARISAGYGGSSVLRDVDLAVPDGSVVALLGPNGAGKTTLLRVLSGLLSPSAGSIRFDGDLVNGWSPQQRAAAGITHVPEGRAIFRSLTVRDNLRLQASRSREDKAIERAGVIFPRLAERLDQIAGTLSGGEQQMLAMARAYVRDARVVLVDEVSMGLAPRVVDEILDSLRLLMGTGTSILLVEQYIHRALELANYVYLLVRGEVRFAGEPSEVADERFILQSYLG